MVQLTVDYMFMRLVCNVSNYFCLYWEKREEPDELPYFMGDVIEGNNFSYGFLNKLIHMPIILSGKIKKRRDKLLVELEQIGDVVEYTNIHFLKSHLQKSIRLKKFSLAIQTTKHLLDIDPIQLLRRLSIIIIEDAFMNKYYSTLIWLMVAISSNKIKLQLHHIEFILGLVHLTCQSSHTETYSTPPEITELSNEKLAKLIDDQSKNIKNKYQHANIQALLIRASYGGMTGDTRMLLNAAYVWVERFMGEGGRWEGEYNVKMRAISGSVLGLRQEDWVVSAIDFHCFPKMLVWLEEEFEIEEGELKHLIWHFSSKINKRKFYNNDPIYKPTQQEEENWQKIRKQVYSIGKYAIKNYS